MHVAKLVHFSLQSQLVDSGRKEQNASWNSNLVVSETGRPGVSGPEGHMTQLSFTSIKAQLFTGSQRLSCVLRYHPEMQKILGLRKLKDLKPLAQESWRLSSHW